MKTFKEFISEAEVAWNTGVLKGSGKSPSDTAKQKMAKLSAQTRNPRMTSQQQVGVAQRIKKMRSAVTGASEVAKSRDPRPETRETQMRRSGRAHVNTGYSQLRDTPISSVGTQSNVGRTGIHDIRTGRRLGSAEAPDALVKDRFASPGSSGSGGKNISRSGGTYGSRG